MQEISTALYSILEEAFQDAIENTDSEVLDESIIDEWIELLKDYQASEDYRMIHPDELYELSLFTEDEIREIGRRIYEIN